MVPWWKRLLYSLVSVIVGAGVVGFAVSSQDSALNFRNHFDLSQLLVSTCIFIAFSSSGWLVAIPVVLLVRNYSGWRMWLWGGTGVCIGPAVILGLALYVYITGPHSTGFAPHASVLIVIAAAVSTLSTCVYLFLVRRRRSF